ncbi:MAG: mechanosensitive ion channel domain-containing protein [Verrucomicrobiota bacterium]|nr:mechanosensitive ion channel domain-containing protein [Verrucomicrobiota bacterium]
MFPLLADEELLYAERMRSLRVGDASLKVDQLKIMLNPMTKDELNELSHAWRNSLKKTVQNISDINLKEKLSLADESRKSAFIENKLKQLILFRTVLAESKKKGGDLSDLEMYANAVSGAQIAVNDDAGFWSKYSSWIYSKEGGVKLGIQLLKFFAIMMIFWALAAFVRRVVRRAAEKSNRFSELLEQFMIKISFRAMMLVGLLVALGTVGINVAALLTVIGGASFIISFALQDTLSNFAAGVMLLIYRPFDVGDAVDVGGVTGKIDQVSLVSTTIKTFDNKVVLVPNKNVWGQIITNSSASKERRVDMIFGIGYDDDSEKAKQILRQIVSDHELVLDEPEPMIQLHELADSSVNFICRPWVKTENYWQVHWDILKQAKSEFDQAGISFPYPQQDVHVHQIN